MNMATYRPAKFVLGKLMTIILPMHAMAIGMAMWNPRSSYREEE